MYPLVCYQVADNRNNNSFSQKSGNFYLQILNKINSVLCHWKINHLLIIYPINTTHVHIVCLDVPYPADYGGVYDLFYKIKALYQLGVKIHLHCFEYGRGRQPELDLYCHEVQYYEREKLTTGIPLRLPYIVTSRINPLLIKNLLKDHYPILLEGVHCTYYLYHGELNGRKVLVRLHNVEFEY